MVAAVIYTSEARRKSMPASVSSPFGKASGRARYMTSGGMTWQALVSTLWFSR